jgi:cell division protein FtsA
MTKLPIITAIDLGSDKCVTLIATGNAVTNQLEVIGISVVESRGIRKSMIVDLEAAISTISESVESAERMAGLKVKSAYVCLNGHHIASQNSKGVVAVAAPNQEISTEDVQRVIESARAISVPTDRTILHVIPRDFRIDSQGGIKDPTGMMGIRLESSAHIVTSLQAALKNTERCITDMGIHVDGFVFAGLASSESIATETEKELGVAVVDIGAGTTTMCVYVDGAVEFSTAIPIGARHITQDLALGCSISIEAAEKIKIALSTTDQVEIMPRPGESKDELTKRRKKADQLDPKELGITEGIGIQSRKMLIERIMAPRMNEIFVLLGQQLQQADLFPMIPAGVVITGGGAETVGIENVAKKTLRLPVRLGVPPQLPGLTADILRPSFSTSIGLLIYGWNQKEVQPPSQQINLPDFSAYISFDKISSLIQKIIKTFLP